MTFLQWLPIYAFLFVCFVVTSTVCTLLNVILLCVTEAVLSIRPAKPFVRFGLQLVLASQWKISPSGECLYHVAVLLRGNFSMQPVLVRPYCRLLTWAKWCRNAKIGVNFSQDRTAYVNSGIFWPTTVLGISSIVSATELFWLFIISYYYLKAWNNMVGFVVNYSDATVQEGDAGKVARCRQKFNVFGITFHQSTEYVLSVCIFITRDSCTGRYCWERVLAMAILSVCLSRPGTEARWDRDFGSSPYASLESLVSYGLIWWHWVRRFPSNGGIKEGYPP